MSETDQTAARAGAQANAPASGLPVLPPLAAVLEVIVLVVVPGLLDYWWPAFPSLNETQPHFFWLPVLLLTLQYGSASGLLAAGVSIMMTGLIGWPEQEIGENHFSYQLRIWLQPMLWLGTAVILGQLRLRQIERKQVLGRAVDDLTGQRLALAAHVSDLRARCDRLERVVATRRAPDARDLMAALGRFEAADSHGATAALTEVLALVFGGNAVSMLAVEDGALQVTFRHAPVGAPPLERIAASSPLYKALIDQRRALSVLQPGSEHDLDGRGVAAVPIFGANGNVNGAVLLETGEPADLDADTTIRLGAIASIVASRLEIASVSQHGPASGVWAEPDSPGVAVAWRRVRRQAGRPGLAAARAARKA